MNTNIVGVTIGIGPKFGKLAQLAANSFERNTGVSARILTEESAKHYPGGKIHHLKFEMFAEVPDFDTIFYFDADTVFLKPIDLSPYIDREEFIAVRDLVETRFIKEEARRAGIAANNYFNSGIFIINRRHQNMLRAAKEFYKRIKGSPFFDQTALNAARGSLKVPIHFLPQKFNRLFFDKCWEPKEIVIGHMPGIESRPWETLVKYYQYWASLENAPDGTIDEALNKVSGREFMYERVGYDSRRMVFDAGGGIGKGRGGCERRWRISAEPEPVLWIIGPGQPTCGLVADETWTWHGRWMWHEQMPIRLIPRN